MNKCIMMGRLTRDPELRKTSADVSVCSFTLAIERDYKKDGEKETDFIDFEIWRQGADFVAKHFTKGRMAVVSGKLQIRGWTDKDGNKRRTAEVLAENVYFGDSKNESGENHSQSGGFTPPAYPAPSYAPPAGDFAPLDDEDAQLPF